MSIVFSDSDTRVHVDTSRGDAWVERMRFGCWERTEDSAALAAALVYVQGQLETLSATPPAP